MSHTTQKMILSTYLPTLPTTNRITNLQPYT